MHIYTIVSFLLAALPLIDGAAIPVVDENCDLSVVTITRRQLVPYVYETPSPVPTTSATYQADVSVDVPVTSSTIAPSTYVPPANISKDDGFTGFRSIGYFADWDIYDRKFYPNMLHAEQFTHILLCFLVIDPTTGEVVMLDGPGDTQVNLEQGTTDWGTGATEGTVKGMVGELFKMKQEYRNLKTMLSVGGWTASSDGKFNKALSTPESRALFASSAVKFVNDFGMDGLDVDWEYPDTLEDGENLADLLRRCREELDKLGPGFELSIAAPCGPKKIDNLPLKEIDESLDFWNLMAYDFAGPGFSKATGHMSNFYPSTENPDSTEFSYVAALDKYLAAGINPRKLITGMPLYGRGFATTDGLGQPFSGAPSGDWEHGVYDYKNLPMNPEDKIFEDEELLASGSYNPDTRVLVSYDTPRMAQLKAQFIMDHGLGGAFWWEVSGDKQDVETNLVQNVLQTFGGASALQKKEGHLEYPNSKYSNIRVWNGTLVAWNRPSFETSS
ncbi:hypothetical protein TWF696_006154 [Orbilia brochopaga]|uniref:chitinase n=1 Tax=Orbilia brochopaga TaxID=3140254 RepID=A0AAV9UXS4_9PEZI